MIYFGYARSNSRMKGRFFLYKELPNSKKVIQAERQSTQKCAYFEKVQNDIRSRKWHIRSVLHKECKMYCRRRLLLSNVSICISWCYTEIAIRFFFFKFCFGRRATAMQMPFDDRRLLTHIKFCRFPLRDLCLQTHV